MGLVYREDLTEMAIPDTRMAGVRTGRVLGSEYSSGRRREKSVRQGSVSPGGRRQEKKGGEGRRGEGGGSHGRG